MDASTIRSLDAELRSITADERRGLVQFLRRLDRLDSVGGYDLFNCRSTFEYLVKEHRLPEGTAWRRVNAMNLIRRFHQLEALLEDGRLNPTQLGILGPVLTVENLAEVVREASHKSTKKTRELAVRYVPRKAPAAGIRKLPERRATSEVATPAPSQDLPSSMMGGVTVPEAPPAAPLPAPARPPGRPAPIASRTWRFAALMGVEEHAKYERLEGLLAHKFPDRDPSKILRQMLDDCLGVQEKRLGYVAPSRPRKPSPPRAPTPGVRAPIRPEVRRQVLERDGHRCTHLYPDGTRCDSTENLEMDHLDPARETGSSEVEDLTSRCKPHNLFRAMRRYGRAYVLGRIEEARREREARRSATAASNQTTLCEPVARWRAGVVAAIG